MNRSKIRVFLHNLHSARNKSSQKKIYNFQERDVLNRTYSCQKKSPKKILFKPYKKNSIQNIIENQQTPKWQTQHQKMFSTLYQFKQKKSRQRSAQSYLFPAVSASKPRAKIYINHHLGYQSQRKDISNIQQLKINTILTSHQSPRKYKKKSFPNNKKAQQSKNNTKCQKFVYNKRKSELIPWQIQQQQILELNY